MQFSENVLEIFEWLLLSLSWTLIINSIKTPKSQHSHNSVGINMNLNKQREQYPSLQTQHVPYLFDLVILCYHTISMINLPYPLLLFRNPTNPSSF